MADLSKFASLSTMTKCSSASSSAIDLMACSVASSVWSPLIQNCECACSAYDSKTNINTYTHSFLHCDLKSRTKTTKVVLWSIGARLAVSCVTSTTVCLYVHVCNTPSHNEDNDETAIIFVQMCAGTFIFVNLSLSVWLTLRMSSRCFGFFGGVVSFIILKL